MTKRGSKRLKSMQEEGKEKPTEDITMRDGSDEDTVTQTNNDMRIYSFPVVSYLKISVQVTKALKATLTMKAKFREVLRCIREADNTAIISLYKLDPIKDDQGMVSNKKSEVITSEEELPDSITALSKYFYGCRPRSEGGMIWTQIRLLHNEPIQNIIADTRTECQEMKALITYQPIQHWNVETIGFLKNLHPDVDGEKMQHYLIEAVNSLNQEEDELLLGIKVRTPYDGIRKDPKKTTVFKDRIQAFHVDVIGNTKERVRTYLKAVLNNADFKKRSKAPVRLVPTYDRRSSPNTQEKIKRCILQHSQFCQSVMSLPCQGIPSLDHKNKSLKKTIRNLIMEMEDTNFINIDTNWSNTNYIILFPRKYESTTKEKVIHLAAFLHKTYGNKILSSFEPATQITIKETTWENGKPISKLDRELDDIIESDDNIDYVDTSYFEEQNSNLTTLTNPSTVFEPKLTENGPVTFVPAIDDGTVSTFGTTLSKSPGKPSFEDGLSIARTSSSETSMVSVLGRVSKVEENMGDMKSLLQQILSAQKESNSQSTQLSCNITAEDPKGSSAEGV